MDRRPTGVVVLIVAIVAALIGPRILQPGLAGQPFAAPLPEPPQVGACLAVESMAPTVVSCAEPHDLEVTARQGADVRGPREDCDEAAWAYIGRPSVTTVGIWSLELLDTDTARIDAPDGQRAGVRGWSVCVIRPASRTRYLGSVRSLPTVLARPAAYGSCAQGTAGVPTPCNTGHTSEYLGRTGDSISDPNGGDSLNPEPGLPNGVRDNLSEQCTSLAGQLTGNPDPTYAGRLRVDLNIEIYADPMAPGSFTYAASCSLSTADGAMLTDSVVGLGNAALPVA